MVLPRNLAFSNLCIRRLLPHRLHAYAPLPPLDEIPTLPPISALTTPYTSTPPLLTRFRLLQHPQDETMMLPSALLTLLHPGLNFSLDCNP
ncbi:hypothetical protein O181_114061 [Austropuccinia psidii MF-1]|uniref:Uncharacterized protein n=1 Tax=Austropuccinia psidii MF-1 TaxID=1389203 RepID=A0A9Q3K656_9BASI|nr:hypothetical protein [Austropuccinia psidii MF-1]